MTKGEDFELEVAKQGNGEGVPKQRMKKSSSQQSDKSGSFLTEASGGTSRPRRGSKRVRPAVRGEKSAMDLFGQESFSGAVQSSIRGFFEKNSTQLVRPGIAVDEFEAKKARTWAFFWAVVQLIVCVVYGIAFSQLRNDVSYRVLAAGLVLYFATKFFPVVFFALKSLGGCCLKSYNPESGGFNEVMICIPVLNESPENLERTVASILNSNYPKEKMYMLFIVDSNKGKTFQHLLTILKEKEWKGVMKPGERMIDDGVHKGVAYSVYLKEQSFGKRDSVWLFVEILKNLSQKIRPAYTLLVSSDTSFSKNSIRRLANHLDKDKKEKVAGVCGKIQVSNFRYMPGGLDNFFFLLSTTFVVVFQYYEYHFNQILGKQAEAAFGAVTHLPATFTMYRTSTLLEIDSDMTLGAKESENHHNTFFSRELHGIVQRNAYDIGQDRALTTRFLEKKLVCDYEPRALAYTEAPDTMKVFLQQRRRWNNSAFFNQLLVLSNGSLWKQIRMLPIMFWTLFDVVSSYLMPAHGVLIMLAIWGPFFSTVHKDLDIHISVGVVVFWWVLIQLVVATATKLETSDMIYVLSSFLSGALMGVAFWWFFRYTLWRDIVEGFIDHPEDQWPRLIALAVLPVVHVLVCLSKPHLIFSAIASYLMLPTVAVTSSIYAWFRLDDFTWGSR